MSRTTSFNKGEAGVSCLFCGKEIGALRFLRKEEFCSSAHKRLYKHRLGKVIGVISKPEPPPAPISGFATLVSPLEGNVERAACLKQVRWAANSPRVLYGFPVAIPAAGRSHREPAAPVAVAAQPAARPKRFPVWPRPITLTVQTPSPAIAAETEFERLREVAALLASDPAGAAPSPAPSPAARLVETATDLAPTAAGSLQLPAFGVVPCEELERLRELAALQATDPAGAAPSLQPAPVACLVEAAAALAPAVAAAAELPAFGVAPSEELERLRELAALQATDPAGAAPSLQPAPVACLVEAAAALAPAVTAAAQLPAFGVAPSEELERLRELAALQATDPAGAAPSLQPAPVACLVEAAAALAPAVTAAAQLPVFAVAPSEEMERLREVAALQLTDPAGAAPSFEPAPVACLVESAADLAPAAPAAAQLPVFAVAPSEELERLREVAALQATELAGAAPSLQPALVARWVDAVSDLAPAMAAVAVRLPVLAVAPVEELERLGEVAGLLASELAGAAPSLQPQPVACLVVAAAALEAAVASASGAVCSFAGQVPAIAAAQLPRPFESLATGKPFEAPAVAGQPRRDIAESPAQPAGRLPRFDVDAVLQPHAMPAAGVRRPPVSGAWMTSPPAAPAMRMVFPVSAESVLSTVMPPAMAQSMAPLTLAASLQLPASAVWQPAARAEAALVDAVPSLVAELAPLAEMRLPAMPGWRAQDSLRGAHAAAAGTAAPEPVETWPTAEPSEPARTPNTQLLSFPMPKIAAVAGRARLEVSSEPDLTPQPVLPAPAAALVAAPMAGKAVPKLGASAGATLDRGLTVGGAVGLEPARFATMDFHCRPKPGMLAKRLQSIIPVLAVVGPRMAVRPIFDRWEDMAPPPEQKLSAGKVLVMPRVLRQIAASKRTRHTIGAVAAGLFLGTSIWLGTTSRQKVKDSSLEIAVNETPAAVVAAHRAPGPIARLRQAIADRSAATWSDTFRTGMQAWGSGPKAWAPGWTRSADGYVQPGALAIFHPTLNYTDYKLEFFGQIEHKSMDWVVRARDARNYYAMKFTVVQPGLRPYIAMVHYAVVGGKKTGYSETPLSVMVHRGRPMQVLVDVKGDRFTASVDGEEVGSWSDHAISTGGVGFFAEAGEKARLYWMRVSRNEDLLGHICAYITGSSGRQYAELWPEAPGGRPHRDGPNVPFEPAQALSLATVVTLRRSRMRSPHSASRAYIAERRIETWRS